MDSSEISVVRSCPKGKYAHNDKHNSKHIHTKTTRAVPKLMPPILLCWLTTSEANIVDMAVEVEPSRQYSVKFCCRATDDSRGAV